MKDTAILKTLTDTTCDSVEGYRKAAQKADSPQLKRLLDERAARREATLGLLNAELVRHGADPVTSGTTSGALHRTFAEVSTLFESNDEAAAERVEEGEDYIAGKFEEAIQLEDLDMRTREVITEAYSEIRQGERLADQLEASIRH